MKDASDAAYLDFVLIDESSTGLNIQTSSEQGTRNEVQQ